MANMTITPSTLSYGQAARVGYQPADPVLVGYKVRLTITRNETTETDIPPEAVDADVIYVEERNVARGAASQRTTFVLGYADDPAWSGGGASAHFELVAPGDTVEDDLTLTVLP